MESVSRISSASTTGGSPTGGGKGLSSSPRAIGPADGSAGGGKGLSSSLSAWRTVVIHRGIHRSATQYAFRLTGGVAAPLDRTPLRHPNTAIRTPPRHASHLKPHVLVGRPDAVQTLQQLARARCPHRYSRLNRTPPHRHRPHRERRNCGVERGHSVRRCASVLWMAAACA